MTRSPQMLSFSRCFKIWSLRSKERTFPMSLSPRTYSSLNKVYCTSISLSSLKGSPNLFPLLKVMKISTSRMRCLLRLHSLRESAGLIEWHQSNWPSVNALLLPSLGEDNRRQHFSRRAVNLSLARGRSSQIDFQAQNR